MMKKTLTVLVAIFMIATVAPIASADLKISGWGISQYTITPQHLRCPRELCDLKILRFIALTTPGYAA